VPEELKTVKPDAKITHIKGNWGGFASEWTTWFLDPNDPLFKDVQLRLLKEQIAIYGTDHLYAADPFNEMIPPSYEGSYLGGVAKSIYDGMAAADPKAIWYQMAWTFYYDSHWLKKSATGETPFAGMCAGVPTGKMVLLDYFCEEKEIYPLTESFHGAPFIWDYLGNFGGCTYLLSPLDRISTRIAKALTVPNCIGVGSTLEGLNINPSAYELTLEQPWHDNGAVDYQKWCADYAARRCGVADPAVVKAWNMLATTVLNHFSNTDKGAAIDAKPAFDARQETTAPKTAQVHDTPVRSKELTSALADAIAEMLKASPVAQAADGYRYDLVNLVRQLLAYDSDNTNARMMAAYRRHDLEAFRTESARLLTLSRDVDTLVGTRHEYLLGPWIRDARAWGSTPTDQDYYEKSARQILTTWGVPGDGLTDYARRQWNGMLATYYLPRWDEFIKRLDASLSTNQPFDYKAYVQWRIKFEGDWVNSTNGSFAREPAGDSIQIARTLFEKYR
jgi:alpha-N-acetylglucosaminidase